MRVFLTIIMLLILNSCKLEDQDNSTLYSNIFEKIGCWSIVQNNKKIGYKIHLFGERIFVMEESCSSLTACGVTDNRVINPIFDEAVITEYNQCGVKARTHATIKTEEHSNLDLKLNSDNEIQLYIVSQGDNSSEVKVKSKNLSGDVTHWEKTILNNNSMILSAVKVDSVGNIIVAGSIYYEPIHPGHETTADNYNDIGSNGSNWGYNDAFVRKYDKDGNVLWTHWIGSNPEASKIQDDTVTSLNLDNDDNIYIAGNTLGQFNAVSFGDLSGQDIFFAKIDSSGQREWIKTIGTSNEDNSPNLKLSSDTLYLTGYSAGDIDGASTSYDSGSFIASYDFNGTMNFIKIFQTNQGYANKVSFAVGNNNDIYLTHNTAEISTTLGSKIIKYNKLGEKVWEKSFFENTDGDFFEVAIDTSSNLFLTGYSKENFDDTLNNTSPGGPNMFLIKLDKNGETQ